MNIVADFQANPGMMNVTRLSRGRLYTSRARPITWQEESEPRYPGLTPCWNCTSHRPNSDGYPHCGRRGRPITIYLYVYEECFGFLPEGQVVRHKCDNRTCINPEHLVDGTPYDNIHDAISRGRNQHGHKHWRAKLSTEQVSEVRALLTTGLSQAAVGLKFGVSQTCIGKIGRMKRRVRS
jgi:hypothetical protein